MGYRVVRWTIMAAVADSGKLIVRSDEVRGGRPRIAGTGVTVRRVVGWYKLGLSPEEISERVGHLSLAQVHAALRVLPCQSGGNRSGHRGKRKRKRSGSSKTAETVGEAVGDTSPPFRRRLHGQSVGARTTGQGSKRFDGSRSRHDRRERRRALRLPRRRVAFCTASMSAISGASIRSIFRREDPTVASFFRGSSSTRWEIGCADCFE